MKRIFTILAITLLGTITMSAQDLWGLAGYLSDKGTFTSGSFSYNKAGGGLILGLEYNYEFNNILSFAPELLGSYMAQQYEESGIHRQDTNVGLSLPLLFRAGYNFTDSIRGYVNVGPAVFLGLVSNKKWSVGSLSETEDNYKDNFSRFDVSPMFGAGLEFMNRFRISVNYSIGLMNTCKVNNCTYKDNTLYILAGFRF